MNIAEIMPNDIENQRIDNYVIFLTWEYWGKPFIDHTKVNLDWFSNDESKEAFQMVVDWLMAGKPKDVTVFDAENGTNFYGSWIQCKLADTIPELYEQKYLKLLKRQYEYREVYKLMDEVKLVPPSEAFEKVKQFVDSHADDGDFEKKLCEVSSYIPDYLEKLEQRRNREDMELKTGIPGLDTMLWGLHRGEVVTIGAETSRGKSALILNICRNLLKSNKKVLYLSTEMSKDEKLDRLLSMITKIPAFKFRKADFTTEEVAIIQKASMAFYENKLFYIYEASNMSIQEIKNLVHKIKPDVVCLDYLGQFKMPLDKDRYDLRIGEFMRLVKNMSIDENVCVLVAAQFNRDVSKREKRIPVMADFKESGSIEQESDICLLLYDDPEAEFNDPLIRQMCGKIDKNRHGTTGIIYLTFQAETLTFYEREKPQ